MPNGGSDCCGTCWFNRANRGEAGSRSRDPEIDPHCDIRDVSIDDPFYTYCANHPHRRPERDPVPIGPVTINTSGGVNNDREAWLPSPDSEEVRQHLLDLLDGFLENILGDRYPIGAGLELADFQKDVSPGEYLIGVGLGETMLWQLGQFREKRAEERIQWISENFPEPWSVAARKALAMIREEENESD